MKRITSIFDKMTTLEQLEVNDRIIDSKVEESKKNSEELRKRTQEVLDVRSYIEGNRKRRLERREESDKRVEEYHKKVDKIMENFQQKKK